VLSDLFTSLSRYDEIWIAAQFSAIGAVTSSPGLTSYLACQLWTKTSAPIQLLNPQIDSNGGTADQNFYPIYDQGSSYDVNPRVAAARPLFFSIDGRASAWRARMNTTASGNTPITVYSDPSEVPNQFGTGGDAAGWGGMRCNNAGGYSGIDTAASRLDIAFAKESGGSATELTAMLTDLWALRRTLPT
jgi:hypothetical protein